MGNLVKKPQLNSQKPPPQMHKCRPPCHLRARDNTVVYASCSCVSRPLPVPCPFHVRACISHGRNGGREIFLDHTRSRLRRELGTQLAGPAIPEAVRQWAVDSSSSFSQSFALFFLPLLSHRYPTRYHVLPNLAGNRWPRSLLLYSVLFNFFF